MLCAAGTASAADGVFCHPYCPHRLLGGGRAAREWDADLGAWVHDHSCCRARACTANHPPTPTSLLVHNLKRGGFRFAAEQISGRAYDHARCVADRDSFGGS